MNWDAIGAVGEIIGALAVVISLVYLGHQVREGARASQAETELEAARMWSDLHGQVARDPQLARIWDAAHTNPDGLSDLDRQRFVWFVAQYVFLVEGLFNQRERGFLSTDTLDPHERTLRGMFQNPIVREWWSSGVSPYSRAFVEHLNRSIAGSDGPRWEYTPLGDLGRPGEIGSGQVHSHATEAES